ncbi:MAG: AI-2E family transporter [Planctomycetes bacterium]|nr:AI-2E family transporter [Planctomycetota bacterium]
MVLSAITLAVIIWLLRYLSDVLVPFAVAVVLAYILNPLVNIIQRRVKNRGIAVAVMMLGIFVLSAVLFVIIVPLIVDQVGRFQDSMVSLQKDIANSMLPLTQKKEPASPEQPVVKPETKEPTSPGSSPVEGSDSLNSENASPTRLGWTELERGWSRFRETANTMSRAKRFEELRLAVSGTYLGYCADEAAQYLRSEEFRRLLASSAKSVALGGLNAIAFLISMIIAITGVIVVLIYLVFLLMDYPEYSKTWVGFLPPAYRETLVEFFVQFDDVLHRYLRGQAVVSLITGTLECVGFTIIGLPMAIPFGLFVGLLTMVPYLPAIAIAPAAVLAALRAVERGSSLIGSLLATYVVMMMVQVIQDTIVTPKVIGKATGLRPVAILLGVFIWGKLLGFLGVVLAIPLTGLGIAYYRRYILQRGIIGKAIGSQSILVDTGDLK